MPVITDTSVWNYLIFLPACPFASAVWACGRPKATALLSVTGRRWVAPPSAPVAPRDRHTRGGAITLPWDGSGSYCRWLSQHPQPVPDHCLSLLELKVRHVIASIDQPHDELAARASPTGVRLPDVGVTQVAPYRVPRD